MHYKQINCEIISTVLSAKLWSMQRPLHDKEVFQNMTLILCSVSNTILLMVESERFKATKILFSPSASIKEIKKNIYI